MLAICLRMLNFAGTVAQNIARFQEIDTESVIFAAQLACCHSLIQGLAGEDITPKIGEGGQALSGGQRQRIGLARALRQSEPDRARRA